MNPDNFRVTYRGRALRNDMKNFGAITKAGEA
jgi:hypothetical protein